MFKKIYRSEPGGIVKVILPSGKSRPLRHVVLHSPTGFGWGYGGSGLADLALSLLQLRSCCSLPNFSQFD